MAKLLALYRKPRNEANFNKHYMATHAPLARLIPGLEKYEISTGSVVSPQGDSPIHLVASLTFKSLEALQAGMASPEGAATVADLANFADGGIDILIFNEQVI